ncbi:MAG TPA: hypothetical protein PK033_05275 [Acetivibrio sp.]|nr:hypothetical protein [Acetivibrio sp.]
MQAQRKLTADTTLNKLMIYPIVLLLYIGITGFLFFVPVGPGYGIRQSFYFLIYSVEALLLGITSKHLVSYYLKGKWAEVLSSACFIMGIGFAVFLFFFYLLPYNSVRAASVGILILAVSTVGIRISDLYGSRIFEESMIKAVSYLIAGFTIYFMFEALAPRGYVGIGLKISLGKLFFFTFLILIVFQMMSLLDYLDYMDNRKISRIALWFRTNHKMKFLAVFSILYLLIDFRRDIMGDAVLAEWIFIFIVLLIAFIVLAVKLSGAVKRSPEQKLNKHLQKISYDKIKDITNISSCIDDFVNNGNRGGLIACLYYMAFRVGIPIGVASNIIAPIIDCKDLEIPSLVTRKKYNVIEERNRQNRLTVVEKVIYNLELYGGGNFYGYRANSSTMPKYH